MSFRKTLLAGLLIAALAACGHGSNTQSNTTTNGIVTNSSAAPSPTNVAAQPMGGTDQAGNAMAVGTLATVPPTVQCGAVLPVWVNTSKHVYHVSTDPYYGRTKHGEYMCPATAKAQGYRPAGGAMKKHHHANGEPTPADTSGD